MDIKSTNPKGIGFSEMMLMPDQEFEKVLTLVGDECYNETLELLGVRNHGSSNKE